MNINNNLNFYVNRTVNTSNLSANNQITPGDNNSTGTEIESYGFFDDFSKNLGDIINEESSSVYDRYNAGNGNNGGALALADIVRALWRTLTK